jgi:serine/threonine protein kinase
MSSDSNARQGGGDAANSSTGLLFSILNDIGASEFLGNFIDDDQDDDCIASYKNPNKVAERYGLPPHLAASFVDKCRLSVSAQRAAAASSISNLFSASATASFASSSSVPESDAPPVDAASLLRRLNLEMVGKLGEGSFGTVYKCKDAMQKRFVAVKLVNDAKNAQAAMREGQKLLQANNKNIVKMHRVLDLNSILGNGSCALEMEVVTGGDLSKHLEAARRRPEQRLPRATVLRLSRQLLQALVYLHGEMKWVHGDIKPQNMLLQCDALPADGSAIDYSDAEIKLADFGLALVIEQRDVSKSFQLSYASFATFKDKNNVAGTEWFLSPEALRAVRSGNISGEYQRSYSDDLWSACLVMLEMDTGLTLEQLMTEPGAIKLEELLTKTSRELLPLLASVLAPPDAASRCKSAAELLQKLDASEDPLYLWEQYDVAANKYVAVHPAVSVILEQAFSVNLPYPILTLPPPLDLNFDIKALLSSATALGSATERKSGAQRTIRRRLKPSALTSSCDIPIWQQLVDGKEWLQCSPATCAKLEIDMKNPSAAPDSKLYRRIVLQPGSIGSAQLPLAMKSEPYYEPAQAADMAVLSKRLHDSLPEFDITDMVQVLNPALASKYADYRHRLAASCNGNPNERILFHFASDFVIPKIWQEGEGHDPRLSVWAEVGKGAYFSEHVMYGYAYKHNMWPSPPSYEVKSEPPIGATMRVFASLVCLGNVADVGPGCESCSSPVWDAWKKEFDYQKPKDPDPKPTRPPAMPLPSDAAHRQHLLDLMQVKDAPRYDSVMSTEGDLATHPSSTNKHPPTGQRMCEVMHPRLKDRAAEWSRQYVLFQTHDSYPMFIVTLTKTRASPFGVQQFLDAGECAPNRLKTFGFNAAHLKVLGKSCREMQASGWSVSDLKQSGYDDHMFFTAGYPASEMKSNGYTAIQLKNAGYSVKDLNSAHFSIQELKDAFDLKSLRTVFGASDLKNAGYSLQDLKREEFTLPDLIRAQFTISDLKQSGYDDHMFFAAGCPASEMKSNGYTAIQLKNAGYSVKDLNSAHFSIQELKDAFDLKSLRTVFGASNLKNAGYSLQDLKREEFTLPDLIRAQFTIKDLKEAGFSDSDLVQSKEISTADLRAHGVDAKLLRESHYYSEEDLVNGGYFSWKSSFPLTSEMVWYDNFRDYIARYHKFARDSVKKVWYPVKTCCWYSHRGFMGSRDACSCCYIPFAPLSWVLLILVLCLLVSFEFLILFLLFAFFPISFFLDILYCFFIRIPFFLHQRFDWCQSVTKCISNNKVHTQTRLTTLIVHLSRNCRL